MLAVNRAALELLGQSADSVGGLTLFEVCAPEERSRLVMHLETLRGREGLEREGEADPVPGGRWSLRARDGRHLAVKAWSQAVSFAGWPAWVFIASDLSEQVRLENEVERAGRLERLGVIAGGVAHDLNNLLGPLLNAVDLLRLRPGHDDPEARRLLGAVSSSALRATGLVRQVLDFARGAGNRRELVDVRGLIEEVAGFVRDTCAGEVEVDVEAAADLWRVEGEPGRLHQVFLNLLINAREAMSGGGRVRVEASNVMLDEIAVAKEPTARPGAYVVVSVTDGGRGIPSAELSRIFEPFFTTKKAGRGTGLGLPTVQAIVREHRGFVTVRSSAGSGTEFRVVLPALPTTSALPEGAADASSPGRAARGSDPGKPGGGRLILLVEDEPVLGELTRRVLESRGYRVIVAKNGREGIEVFCERRQEIALVMTDRMLPDMDGERVVAELEAIDPDLPIITSSGAAEPEPEEGRSREESPERVFLAKPYSPEELLRTVAECLRQHG